MRIPRLIFVTALAASGAPATAQPAFEVASIKPDKSGERFVSLPQPVGGRFTARNVTPRMLLHIAFRVQDFQISGAPGWIDSERYDIAAAAANPSAGMDQIRLMLRSLIEDRFRMAVHNETREQPVYALVIARNGPKLEKAKSSVCAGTPTPDNRCGGFRIAQRSFLNGLTVTVAQLAEELSFMLDRKVIDQTGIQGLYDIRLEWTPDQFGAEPGAEPRPDDAAPSLFTALQEKLGLRLRPERGPVEMLVIDRIERPSEN